MNLPGGDVDFPDEIFISLSLGTSEQKGLINRSKPEVGVDDDGVGCERVVVQFVGLVSIPHGCGDLDADRVCFLRVVQTYFAVRNHWSSVSRMLS
ncbi:hypothetical protein TNIN_143911 [Trichonephila inaurata madagascariensis]|uniref:Uncharacterized protein n=1 Tax=Trichonephila inaurata madagascariensis TaxID=2747483 RepID=A0A8X6XLN8_9ARAC|nr:hypothetical protein TNIN_143911 [Trichonephila inaurata madagascariensis]